jgi:short-subunit dehydrogenase
LQTQDKCRSEGAADCQCHTCDLADPKAVQGLADQLAGQGVDVAIMK